MHAAPATGPDVFVSYTGDDLGWAEWIAWQLENAGYPVVVQAWDFVAGSSWVEQMDRAVRGSRRTLVVLSSAYLRHSVYGAAEWHAAWAADPLGRSRTLLTVRVEECERPGFLGQLVGIDIFGVNEDEARRRLMAMMAAAISGRAKPDAPPPFPSSGGALRAARFPRSS